MKKSPRTQYRREIITGLFCLIILVAAYGMKAHYRSALGEALGWILAPTAGLTEVVTGIRFLPAGNEGWLSRERGVCIAPSCAGINYLIIAFCMAGFLGVHRFPSVFGKTGWLIFALLSAYGTTLMVNTSRIILSIHLYEAEIYTGWLTPERAHRIGGVFIYLISLYLFYLVLVRLLSKLKNTGRRSGFDESCQRFADNGPLFPLFWYLSVALGIPVLNAAFQENPPRFLEHAVTVLLICALAGGIAAALRRRVAGVGKRV